MPERLSAYRLDHSYNTCPDCLKHMPADSTKTEQALPKSGMQVPQSDAPEIDNQTDAKP